MLSKQKKGPWSERERPLREGREKKGRVFPLLFRTPCFQKTISLLRSPLSRARAVKERDSLVFSLKVTMSPITPFASGAGERGREASDKAREREREQELESRGCSLEVVERGRGETSSSSPLPVSPLFVPCEAYCSPSDTKAIVRRGNANFALPSPESQRTQKRTQDAAWLSRCLSRHVETILRHAFLVALTAAHLSLFPPPDAHSHRHFSSAVWRKGRIRFGKGALFRIPPRNHGGTEEKQGGATRCGGGALPSRPARGLFPGSGGAQASPGPDLMH